MKVTPRPAGPDRGAGRSSLALEIAKFPSDFMDPRGFSGISHQGIGLQGAEATLDFRLWSNPGGLVAPSIGIEKFSLYQLDHEARVLDQAPIVELGRLKASKTWVDANSTMWSFAVELDPKKLDPGSNYIAVFELSFGKDEGGIRARTSPIGVFKPSGC